MPAHAIGVLRIGTPAVEIALVAVKRFADRDRAVRIIGAGLTARQRPRHIDRLPVGQDMLAVGRFKIVGQPDALDPVRAWPVQRTDQSRRRCCAGSPIRCPARSSRSTASSYLQTAAGGGGFELGVARLRHLTRSPCPMKCPKERRTLAWIAIERHGGSCCAPTICCYPRSSTGLHRAAEFAPPWRFSAGGRASISGIATGSVQRAPRSQVVVPGGRGPGPPEPTVTSRSRRTPLLAPPSGSSLEDALHERGWESLYNKFVT